MIRPLRNYVIVKRTEVSNTTKGGIILAASNTEAPTEGTVMAAGKGKTENGTLVPMEIAVGDVVLFPEFAGSEISCDGEKYLMMLDTDIFAVVD